MKINFSFIILVLFSLYIGYFNKLFLFLICLFIHEIGHIITVILFKVKIKKFSLSIFGGVLELDEKDYNNLICFKKIIIYISGIIMNIIFCLLFEETEFGNYHLILFFFNSLPIYPLDGFNIFKIMFNNTVINNINICFIIILLIISIYNNSFGLIIISVILIIQNIKYYKSKDRIFLLKLINNMI